jgi:hypothetical protein
MISPRKEKATHSEVLVAGFHRYMDENNNLPVDNNEADNSPPPEDVQYPVSNSADANGDGENASMEERLERLGGEPAPAITPEEFARLQKAGQVHIDAQGRVRTTRRSGTEAGVSLQKRRAWYH